MAKSLSDPAPPASLGAPGRALFRKIQAGIDPAWELDERDYILLREAAALADTIHILRAAIEREGAVLTTDRGPRVHPGIAEVRASVLALARLLSQIDMEAGAASQTATSRRARKAAQERWRGAGASRRGEVA
jgi:hypothetical protein